MEGFQNLVDDDDDDGTVNNLHKIRLSLYTMWRWVDKSYHFGGSVLSD
jgi:hypothetical protein